VHYPTDINLLFDAIRKVITLIARLSEEYGLFGWRQYVYNIKTIKSIFWHTQKLKRSTSKNPQKKEKRNKIIAQAHQFYIDTVSAFLQKVDGTLESLRKHGVNKSELADTESFIAHAKRQINQIKRRVIEGETIPHGEKVFSVFEKHTEWICKGKAGVPVELGVKVCVVEDSYGFILHHKVMQNETDEKVAVSIVKETQERFPEFKTCSFDKGFYSSSNKEELAKLLDLSVLPKKGRLSEKDKEIEHSEEFIKARRKHATVESGINALEVHGLDRCPDHGIHGFKKYVALAVVARNIQKLGSLIQKKQSKSHVLQEIRKKTA